MQQACLPLMTYDDKRIYMPCLLALNPPKTAFMYARMYARRSMYSINAQKVLILGIHMKRERAWGV